MFKLIWPGKQQPNIFTLISIQHLFIFLCLGMSTSCVLGQYYDAYIPTPIPDRIILTWSHDPSISQCVSWRTDTTVTNPIAEITLSDPSPDFPSKAIPYPAITTEVVTDRGKALYHTVEFGNLLPEKQYVYRVGDKKNWSEWLQFTTASKKVKPFSFIYFGDAQNALKSHWSRVVRSAFIELPKADFMLHAGDLVNRATWDQEWGEWFYAGGWMFGMIPSLATPGNHEYFRNSAGKKQLTHLWRPTFSFPLNGPNGLKETVYFIDYQGTKIISLNSQAMLLDKDCLRQQMHWLEDVLEKNKSTWTILTLHHPIYSSKSGRDNPEIRKALVPIFEKYNVDLVLQGHDHTYGRGRNIPTGKKNVATNSPVYVVSVSGPKMYDLTLDNWMERMASNTQLFQTIHVDKDSLSYKAFTVTGELYDGFCLVKQKNGPTEFIEQVPPGTDLRIDLPPMYSGEYNERELREYHKRFKYFKSKIKDQPRNNP